MKAPAWIFRAFIFGLLATHLILLGLSPIGSEDTWWHLKEGELYLTTMSLPDQDPFAFTTEGREWIHYSWAADILFYVVFRGAGLNGLVLFRLALLCAIASVLYTLLRRCGLHPHASVLLVFLASLALRFRLLIRPEIFAFLLLLATMTVLLRLQTGPRWGAYLLLPIQLAWANVHASFVFGIEMPVLVFLANLLPASVAEPGWGRLRLEGPRLRHLLVSVICLPLVSLVNPHGVSLLLFPFRQNRMSRLDIFPEWMGVWNLPWMGPSWWEILIALGVVVLAFVVSAGLLLVREGRVDPVGWGIALSMGTYAALRCRAVPFFVLAILPLTALALVRVTEHALAGETVTSHQRLRRVGALACLLVLGAAILDQGFLSSRFSVGFGVDPHVFPEGAVAFMERHRLDGRVFNTYHFGGYLTWRRWPANLVMIDGRYDAILFDEELLEQYMEAHESAAAFDRLTAMYDVQLLVLDATTRRRMMHINRHPGWARVYWDSLAEVFVRRGERFAQVIATHEYRLTRHEGDLVYLKAYRDDPETWGRALAELRRAAEDNPANTLAWLGLAQEYSVAGPSEAARRLAALNRAAVLLDRAPSLAGVRGDRADALLQLGRWDEAAAEAREALRLQADLLLPRWVLASIAGRRRDWREARTHLQAIWSRLGPDDPRASIVKERLDDVERRLDGAAPQP